jgi:hypothetical protein
VVPDWGDWGQVSGERRLQLPNGALVLEAWPQDDAFAPIRGREFPVRAEALERVEFALDPGLELRVRLVGDPDLRHYSVLLLEEAARDTVRAPAPSEGCGESPSYEVATTQPFVLRELTFDEGGVALVRGLGPGRYCLRAFPEPVVLEPDVVDVTAHGPRAIELGWRRVR